MRPLMLALLVLAFPATAAAQPYKILHHHHTRVRRIGPLEVYGGHGTLAAAKAAFGTPSSLQNTDSASCMATWSTLGLTLFFGNKHSSNDTCHAHGTIVVSFSATGDQFQTHKGLRPGMTVAQLHQKYPNAASLAGGLAYAIESATVGGVQTTLITALVGGGKVTDLSGSAAEATLV
jgi:hypothetical protein